MRNPHADLEQEAADAVTAFEEAVALHEEITELLGDNLIEFRRMRGVAWDQVSGTVPEKKDKVERIAAHAEAEYIKAEKAERRVMEVLRMRREEVGVVRSRMANQREERNAYLRDGVGRGA